MNEMDVDYSLFTEKARNLVKETWKLARQCQYAVIEPQLMMVSLIRECKDMFSFMVSRLSIDKIAFCTAIGDSLQVIPRCSNGSSDVSPDLKRVLIKSIDLARETGGQIVAIEHIFWAMCCEQTIVRDIMIQFGFTDERVKDLVWEYHGGTQRNNDVGTEESDISTLKLYAKNLIAMAENGEIEPVIGRDDEIRRVLHIVLRKTKNNPVLVGEPGTGKTAIVEGLAFRILRGDVPEDLKGIRLYELDLAAMLAGASAQGQFEERLKQVISEVSCTTNVVLFIDELHTLIGAGRSSGAMDAANILKPELARGSLKIIGATTIDEYRNYIEKDKAFERRFQRVIVDEPSEESAITIMRGIKSRFEKHHRIKISLYF